jgi:hypothetical protein
LLYLHTFRTAVSLSVTLVPPAMWQEEATDILALALCDIIALSRQGPINFLV